MVCHYKFLSSGVVFVKFCKKVFTSLKTSGYLSVRWRGTGVHSWFNQWFGSGLTAPDSLVIQTKLFSFRISRKNGLVGAYNHCTCSPINYNLEKNMIQNDSFPKHLVIILYVVIVLLIFTGCQNVSERLAIANKPQMKAVNVMTRPM